MQITRQQDVSAGRDNAGRDIINHNITNIVQPRQNQIAILYEKFRAEAEKNSLAERDFIEDLQHYIERPASQIVRTLRDKLAESGRTDLVESAEVAKERAMKRIVRFQTSQTAQEIFAYTLGELHSRFTHHVRPLIVAGAPRAAIDAAVYSEVLNPVVNSAEPSELGMNPAMVEAFLYFLAGNCHIQWD
jgi:hypothetical protein